MFIVSLLIIIFGFSSIQACELSERDKKESEAHVQVTHDEQLLRAVEAENCEEVEFLLKAGANPNIYYRDEDGSVHILAHPVIRKNLEMVDLLLFYKADPDCLMDCRDTNSRNIRGLAVTGGNLELIERMKSYRPESALNSSGFRKLPEVTRYLLSNGADVNRKIEDATPLMAALKWVCRKKDDRILIPNMKQVKYLLSFGANKQKEIIFFGETTLKMFDYILLKNGIGEKCTMYDHGEKAELDTSFDSETRSFEVIGVGDYFRDIHTLLADGPTEKDYEETSRDFIGFNCEPKKRGNIFTQLSDRQHGVSKQMSAFANRRKKKEDV